MRKLYLLPFLLFLCLTSCKDEEKVAPIVPLSEQLKGDWKGVKHISHYYDENNQEFANSVDDIGQYWNIKDSTYTVTTNPTETPEPKPYYLSERDGKHYITTPVSLPDHPFEFTISGDSMRWVTEFYNTRYFDKSTNTLKPVHRKVFIVKFVKR